MYLVFNYAFINTFVETGLACETYSGSSGFPKTFWSGKTGLFDKANEVEFNSAKQGGTTINNKVSIPT